MSQRESLGPGRSKLSRRGPGAREQRAKEKEQERRARAREKKG